LCRGLKTIRGDETRKARTERAGATAIAGHPHISSTQKYLDLRQSVIGASLELI